MDIESNIKFPAVSFWLMKIWFVFGASDEILWRTWKNEILCYMCWRFLWCYVLCSEQEWSNVGIKIKSSQLMHPFHGKVVKGLRCMVNILNTSKRFWVKVKLRFWVKVDSNSENWQHAVNFRFRFDREFWQSCVN